MGGVERAGVELGDEIFDTPGFRNFKRGKSMGEDGLCDEFVSLLRKLGEETRGDLKTLLKVCYRRSFLPRYQRGAIIKPILKPNKEGTAHNEYRKLSIMSVLRNKLEKLGSVSMRGHWTAGAYQGWIVTQKPNLIV